MKRTGFYKKVKSFLLGLFTLCCLLSSQAAMAQKYGIIYYDYIDEHGVLKGGIIEVDPTNPKHTVVEGARAAALPEGAVVGVETIIDNGPTWNRVDFAILGDGYTEPNLGVYANDVANLMAGFFSEPPLDEYASFFNVHRVDIKSGVSGIENCNGEQGRTPLEMCFGEPNHRALYINVWNAKEAANHEDVPDWQQILALANSSRYGGGGYIDHDIATVSARNEWTVQIALHEFGHSFANLEDEYFDPNGVEYTDPESTLDGIANLSTLYASDMNEQVTKWYRWLGEPTVPDVNRIGTYVGGMRDYNEGIYRPTDWSKMRHLNYPFYQVNVEQFVLKIYGYGELEADDPLDPIDYATPGGTYAIGTKFFVQPVKPATHSLDVTWYRVGDPDPVGTGTEFDSSTLDLPTGEYTLQVKVVDNTPMVKDEDARVDYLTEWREWTLGEAGHWKFDEGSGGIAEDSIGDSNGTLFGDPTWLPSGGKVDGALLFDGDGDYVSISEMNALADNSTTISAWINTDTEINDFYPIVTQCDTSIEKGYYLYLYGDTPAFWLDGAQASSSETISKDNWYHIVGTNDGSNLKIYVNGVQRGTANSTGKAGGSYDAYIGSDGGSVDDNYFDGTIDDVRVYDWAMDQAQIWEIMYPGTSKFSVKDNSGVLMAWFDDLGNLFLKGTLTERRGLSRPTATDDDEFIFKDSNGNLMIINTTNGNMDIYGEHLAWQAPSGENDFIVKDSEGAVAYIDESGNLYLTGELYENPE